MGYLHIDNLYRNQKILEHKECYALEKVHGTSAHISWDGTELRVFGGCVEHLTFRRLVDSMGLAARLVGHEPVIIYGEAFGGKINGQSWRYGSDLRFVAFDVRKNDRWLDVPEAERFVLALGLTFVDYSRIPTDLPSIDAERDKPSTESVRVGIVEPCRREGVVLRPIRDCDDGRGNRLITKHKRDEERETKTPRQVVDPDQQRVLVEAREIAEEWVTETRLDHVLDKLPPGITDTGVVIRAMMADIEREGSGEFLQSKAACKAIGTATAKMHRARLCP
jgi:hypothetical protein